MRERWYCDDLLSELQGLNRTELNCLYILFDCRLLESDGGLDKVVLGTDRERVRKREREVVL